MNAFGINTFYGCKTCKSAADAHGRGCQHGMLFPVLLVMANQRTCPNYEMDSEKAAQAAE